MPVSITCESCSAKVRVPDAAVAARANLKCPKCKEKLALPSAKKSAAPAPLPLDPEPLPIPEEPAAKKGLPKSWLIGGGVAAGVLLVGGVFYFALSGGVTLDNLMKCKSGMTEAEVVALLGKGTVVESRIIPAGTPSLFSKSDHDREFKTIKWKGMSQGAELETQLVFEDGKLTMGPGDMANSPLGSKDPKALAEELQKDPTKALENVLGSLGGPKVKDPENLTEALNLLKSKEAAERSAGLKWLSKAPLDKGKQAEVAKVLDEAINEPKFGGRPFAIKALDTWATAENVPTLIKLLDDNSIAMDPNDQPRHRAMTLLAKLQDERGAAPIAGYLDKAFEDDWALKSLQAMGPVAEKAVLKYLNAPHGGARDRARKLLAGYKTKENVLLAQTVEDLSSTDQQRCQVALEWLGGVTMVDEELRPKVAGVLDKYLTVGNEQLAVGAVKALAVWATADNVPALLTALENSNNKLRHGAMEALARLKDDRAIAPIAQRLTEGSDRQVAGKALEKFGPKAEQELLKYLESQDKGAREEAKRILKTVGAKDNNVELTQAIADVKATEPGRRSAGLKWFSQAKPDKEKQADAAMAIEVLLEDNDKGIQEQAAKVLWTWGTPDNVPALLKALGSQNANLRHAAITALEKIKDDRAIAPLAQRLTDNGDRFVASKALKAFGKASEKEVLKILTNNDKNVRIECCHILEEIGTRASLGPLDTAARNAKSMNQKDVYTAAESAIGAIKRRN